MTDPMLTVFDIFALACGLLIGLSLAFLHTWLSRRAVEELLAGGSRRALHPGSSVARVHRVLLGFPVRVLLPAIGLAALVLLSNGSLLAGLLGFLLGQRVALHHMPPRTDV
uniref:Uncharacterized protein n=1 Tax=uncultured bacterium pSY1435 TaxID=561717 RepID=C4N422_9BACT|nr:unknown protein [uncultured bacterium pSY1435]